MNLWSRSSLDMSIRPKGEKVGVFDSTRDRYPPKAQLVERPE